MTRPPDHSFPSQDTQIDKNLLDRYLAGEGTPIEVAAVREWLAANPQQAVRIHSDPSSEWARARVNADWELLSARVFHLSENPGDIRSVVGDSQQRSSTNFRRTLLRPRFAPWLGAALTFALAVGLSTNDAVRGSIVSTLSQLSGDDQRSPKIAHEYSTRAGERVQISLIDGSEVVLGPDSKLSILDNYGIRNRSVILSGAGHFRVIQNSGMPFTVNSGIARVEVLGTVFGVRNYTDDPQITVAVAEGRVAVSAEDGASGSERSIVNTNQIAEISSKHESAFTTSSGRYTVIPSIRVRESKSLVESALAWTDNVLTFENTPLQKVLPELARLYGVEFKVMDSSINRLKLTGGFAGGVNDELAQQSIDDLVHTLSSVLMIRVTYSGRTITLRR